MSEVILEAKNIFLSFHGVAALTDVSFQVRRKEIFSIIGPNGAGKTCMMNCVSGLYHPKKGKMFFKGNEITKHSPHRRAALGISRTFQKIELFGGMSVLDNIRLGRHLHLRSGLISSCIYWGGAVKEEVESRKFIEEEIIDLLEIQSVRNEVTSMLPYGVQKRIELARALALQPEVILLDEPLAGLNLEEVEDMARFIIDINEDPRWNVTCVLVEHDMGVVMDLSDRVLVLNFGVKIAEGTPAEIQENPEVVKAYLGEAEDLYVSRR
jgi:branched-chain amino acid transport system ATP-binding protein